ncbi:MAG TPA: T9SS type A sorting domain-containing protein [Bacteroidia bacterium]|jgi:hypothetical protein|nr:T9SS type A sorting domain-containing protein [Bacteroidia bacterium]
MRPFLLSFFFFLCCATNSLRSQSIVAGQHQQWDYYHDFLPDTVIYGMYPDSMMLDLNGDGLIDAWIFSSYQVTWNWGFDRTFWIRPAPTSEVAFLRNDTCMQQDGVTVSSIVPLAKPFNTNDTINNAATWSDSICYLQRYKSDVTQFYSCYNASFHSSYQYAGIRIFTPDTLYGWIKMKITLGNGMNDDTLHIDSYACQTGPAGINSPNENSTLHIFPDPSDGIFYCNEFFHSANLEIHDVAGKLLLTEELHEEKPVIDLSAYESGIYFLTISEEGRTYNAKLVVH